MGPKPSVQLDDHGMTLRKIDAMHHFYGCDPLNGKCKDCPHLISGDYHDRKYYKCTVYGCSHSEATDWRISYDACGLIDHDFPENDKRVIDILKHEHIQKTEQLPGQISVEEMLREEVMPCVGTDRTDPEIHAG